MSFITILIGYFIIGIIFYFFAKIFFSKDDKDYRYYECPTEKEFIDALNKDDGFSRGKGKDDDDDWWIYTTIIQN